MHVERQLFLSLAGLILVIAVLWHCPHDFNTQSFNDKLMEQIKTLVKRTHTYGLLKDMGWISETDPWEDHPSLTGECRLTSFKHSKFAHSALRLEHLGHTDCTRFKKFGLITSEPLSFGTILAVEYPMIKWTDEDISAFKGARRWERKMEIVHDLVRQQQRQSPGFGEFWDELEETEQLHTGEVDDPDVRSSFVKVC